MVSSARPLDRPPKRYRVPPRVTAVACERGAASWPAVVTTPVLRSTVWMAVLSAPAAVWPTDDPDLAGRHRHRRVAHRSRQLADGGEVAAVDRAQDVGQLIGAVVAARQVDAAVRGGGTRQVGSSGWELADDRGGHTGRGLVGREGLDVRCERGGTAAEDQVAAADDGAGGVMDGSGQGGDLVAGASRRINLGDSPGGGGAGAPAQPAEEADRPVHGAARPPGRSAC